MKKITTLLSVFIITSSCLAANLYVNADVDTSGDGSIDSPFLTIQEAADIAQAGDVVIIHEGQYRETITPANSGTASQPITYTAYEADLVTINGCDIVNSAWSLDEGSIYKTNITLNLDHENQVFVNSTSMVWEARWPNVGSTSLDGLLEFNTATMDAGTSSTVIVDNAIPDYDWTGGTAWVSSNKRWFSWTGELTSYASGQVGVVNNADGANNMICASGGVYYLFGVRDALDSANEWYYDASTEELYIWAPDGNSPVDVEVKERLYGFDLSERSYINIQNLNFFACGINTDINSSALVLDSLEIKHVYHSNEAEAKYGSQNTTGLILYGTDHILKNSEISYGSGAGVFLSGSGHQLINNYIHDHDYIGAYASPLVMAGKNLTVSHNTIKRAGRQCVLLNGIYGSLFQYNDVSHGGYLTWDLGLIYGNSIAGGHAEVRYNWLHDNMAGHFGDGLYYDHGCKNILTHHNVVWNVPDSALKHNQYANYLLWYNNTGIGDGSDSLKSRWTAGQRADLFGCHYTNNVFNNGIDINGSGFRQENNFTNYSQFIDNLYLTPDTAPVDAAYPIVGITTGDSPDAGAYEVGGEIWTPGHNFSSPPAIINTTFNQPIYKNRVINGSFEDGTLSPWVSTGSTTNLEESLNINQWIANGTTLLGKYSAKLGAGQTGITQTIYGLEPNSSYTFMGKLRVEPGETAYLGVQNHGQDEIIGSSITDTITGATANRSGATNDEWQQTSITFTTGADSTSADIYVWKNSTGTGSVFFEDGGVQLQQVYNSTLVDENFENGLSNWNHTTLATVSSSNQSLYNNFDTENNGVTMVDTTATQTELTRTISVDDTSPLYIQFDYRYTGTVRNAGFQLLENSSRGLNMHLSDANGKIANRNSSTFETLYQNLPADTWFRFTFTINPVSTNNDQYSLRLQRLSTGDYVDEYYSGLSFQNDITSITSIKFHYNVASTEAGGEYHIDNVLVTLAANELNLQTDTDADGIDDAWEMAYFGNLNTADTVSNNDGDNLSDLEEYHVGSSPNDRKSRFSSPRCSKQQYTTLSFDSSLSREYEVWWSEELTNWNLGTVVNGTGNEVSLVIDTLGEGNFNFSQSEPQQLFLRVHAKNATDLGSSN